LIKLKEKLRLGIMLSICLFFDQKSVWLFYFLGKSKNIFQGLGENTYLLQLALKNTAPGIYVFRKPLNL